MKNIIQFSSQIDDVKAKKDRTLSIKIGTQELSADETSKIFDLMSKQIWIALCEVALAKEDLNIPDEIKEFSNRKSLSERLRDVLWVWWNQKYQIKYPNFEEFRQIQMEKLIQLIKDKLD